ncbi:MAG: hypothetical protein KDE09_04610 [Anaerolineales bacterium]|nr:hypothetical protein [Anaerolineales bacterium]MCB0017049.1 hypothetical protein [Anaerolineales bacterium]MCB0026713.1 hypothetical protein [Anaerolineales bacterium]MCB8962058.1 hypothetical protein [Ardenticatenales bacterium]
MSKSNESTLSALLEDKPRRGRPRRKVSRQNVYVALTDDQKTLLGELAGQLPGRFSRADVADLAVTLMTVRLEALRRSVADRDREMPEGITDFISLYLLWDLPLPAKGAETKWTTVRLSPQHVVDLGRAHGGLGALFGASRSDVFGLSLALLQQFVDEDRLAAWKKGDLNSLQNHITAIYL